MQQAARTLGLQIQYSMPATIGDIDAAFAALARERPDALFVGPDGFFASRRVQLITLAARDRIPATYANREDVVAGGLMSYGTDVADSFVKSASIPAASSRAPSPPNCLCCRQPNSSLSSTFKRRERSTSRCRQGCSPSPTR